MRILPFRSFRTFDMLLCIPCNQKITGSNGRGSKSQIGRGRHNQENPKNRLFWGDFARENATKSNKSIAKETHNIVSLLRHWGELRGDEYFPAYRVPLV